MTYAQVTVMTITTATVIPMMIAVFFPLPVMKEKLNLKYEESVQRNSVLNV